jgi:hypothetical protein
MEPGRLQGLVETDRPGPSCSSGSTATGRPAKAAGETGARRAQVSLVCITAVVLVSRVWKDSVEIGWHRQHRNHLFAC